MGFDHNIIIPQIAQNTLPRLKPSFSKMWKCLPNTKNSYSLIFWRPLSLQNTSLDAKFRVHNFGFWLINQRLNLPGSTISLNWGKCPRYTKICIIQLTVSLQALVGPYLMQNFDLKTLDYLLCTTIQDLRDYAHHFQLLQYTKYINSLTLSLPKVLTLEKHIVGYKS